VVQQLPHLQLERSVREQHRHAVYGRCDVVPVERSQLLAEIRRDEDQTEIKRERIHVEAFERKILFNGSAIAFYCASAWLVMQSAVTS